MKYVVACADKGYVYYMDNKLYDHKKQAYNRLHKLNESGLKVYRINRFIMDEVSE